MSEDDGSGNVIREYIWLDDLPVALVDNTGMSPVTYYIHTDQVGRPQKMTDGSANLVWDAVYDPFGNVSSVSGTATNLLMFPGQLYDSETALAQNWNREYDPTLGRYIQSDPIGLFGGINTYTYVLGNPLFYVDQTGTGPAGAAIGAEAGGYVGGLIGSAAGPEGTAAGALLGEDLGAAAGSALEDMILKMAKGGRQNQDCDCDKQAERDEQTCRMATVDGSPARARCWASVQERFGECRAGRPLPPLVMW